MPTTTSYKVTYKLKSQQSNCNQPFKSTIGEYQILKKLGMGSYGKVFLVWNRITNEKLAMKQIERNRSNPIISTSLTSLELMDKLLNSWNKPLPSSPSSTSLSSSPPSSPKPISPSIYKSPTNTKPIDKIKKHEIRILREANLSKLLNHDNIVKLRDFRSNPRFYYLFFELVDGVQLSELIGKNGMDLDLCRKLFIGLSKAIAYCHGRSIVHRDIKIENIMVSKAGDIKLIDFGLANFFDPYTRLATSCGTLPYTSPEILLGKGYTGPEVDIWSLGVVLFCMVTGYLPFGDPRHRDNYFKILASDVHYPFDMPHDCKDLIKLCLNPSPKERITAKSILTHPFLTPSLDDTLILLKPAPNSLDYFLPLPTSLDSDIVTQVADTLYLTYNQAVQLLEKEQQQGIPSNHGKVLCRTCPVVSAYNMINSHEELKSCKMMKPSDEVVKIRVGFKRDKETLNKVGSLKIMKRKPSKRGWSYKVKESHEGNSSYKGGSTRRIGLDGLNLLSELCLIQEKDGELDGYINNLKGNQHMSRILRNPSRKRATIHQLQPKSPILAPSPLASPTLIPLTYKKYSSYATLKVNPTLIRSYSPHQLNANLLNLFDLLQLQHVKSQSSDQLIYIVQYAPSIQPKHHQLILDCLSSTIEVELIGLRSLFKVKEYAGLKIRLVTGNKKRVKEFVRLIVRLV